MADVGWTKRLFGFVLIAAVLFGSCGPRVRLHKKRHLAALPRNFKRGTLEVSLDGDRVAYVVRKLDAREYVVDDGKAGPVHDHVTRPVIVPKHGAFYLFQDGSAGRIQLVAGGETVDMDLDANARGKPMIEFARDGSHWVAAGSVTPEGGDPRIDVFVDGVRRASYLDVSRPAFSPDGKHFAYLAEDQAGEIKFIVDGVEQGTFALAQVNISPLMKNPDEAAGLSPALVVRYLNDNSLVVLATDRDGWAVYKDGARIGSYINSAWRGGNAILGVGDYQKDFGILSTTLTAADVAPVVGWWERVAGQEERWRMVRDGWPVGGVFCSRPADEPPALTPDGKHVGFACYSGDTMQETARVVFDQQPLYAPARAIFGVQLSRDGQHIAYAASDRGQGPGEGGGWRFYRDGEAITGGEPFDATWRPRFSDDGQHIAWEGRRGGPQVRGVLGLDGKEIVSFDAILWGPEFREKGFVSWIIRRGVRVTRLDIGL